jgi:hypothetical protein
MSFRKAIAYPVLLLSAAGIFASIALFLLSLAGVYRLPDRQLPSLFCGIIVVWFPTVILMNRLTRDFKQKDLWKAALRGCPSWMTTALWVFLASVMAITLLPLVSRGRPSEQGFILFPSVFYAVSFCTVYSLIRADAFDASRRCLNGHAVSPLAKFCEECGAPTAPGPPQVGVMG